VRDDLLMGRYRRIEGDYFSGMGTMVATGASVVVAGGTNRARSRASVCIEQHLEAVFGHKHLDESGRGRLQRSEPPWWRRGSPTRPSTTMFDYNARKPHSQVDVDLIASPKGWFFSRWRPGDRVLEIEQYARLLRRREKEGGGARPQQCPLAGEAGLRGVSPRRLRWREDVDMVAGDHHREPADEASVVGTPKAGLGGLFRWTASALGCAQACAGDEGRTGDSKPGWPGQD